MNCCKYICFGGGGNTKGRWESGRGRRGHMPHCPREKSKCVCYAVVVCCCCVISHFSWGREREAGIYGREEGDWSRETRWQIHLIDRRRLTEIDCYGSVIEICQYPWSLLYALSDLHDRPSPTPNWNHWPYSFAQGIRASHRVRRASYWQLKPCGKFALNEHSLLKARSVPACPQTQVLYCIRM